MSVGGHGFARILWAASLRQASANSPQRPGGEVGEVDSGPERSRGEPSAPEARGQCVGVGNSEYNYILLSEAALLPTIAHPFCNHSSRSFIVIQHVQVGLLWIILRIQQK